MSADTQSEGSPAQVRAAVTKTYRHQTILKTALFLVFVVTVFDSYKQYHNLAIFLLIVKMAIFVALNVMGQRVVLFFARRRLKKATQKMIDRMSTGRSVAKFAQWTWPTPSVVAVTRGGAVVWSRSGTNYEDRWIDRDRVISAAVGQTSTSRTTHWRGSNGGWNSNTVLGKQYSLEVRYRSNDGSIETFSEPFGSNGQLAGEMRDQILYPA